MKNFKFIKAIFFFGVGTLIYSCSTEKSMIGSNQFSYSLDTVSISIGDDYLNIYFALPNCISGNYIYAFNNKTNAIDIFDLSKKQSLNSIVLEKEGPDGIPPVTAFTICDSTLIVESYDRYSLISLNGTVKKRILKSDLSLGNDSGYSFITNKRGTVGNFKSLLADCDGNKLFVPIYSTHLETLKDKYQGYCVSSVDIENAQVELLPIPYPEIFRKGTFYGNMDEPQMTLDRNRLIYNFPNSSEIFIFDTQTKKTTSVNILSDYSENTSKSLSVNADDMDIITHYLSSVFFHRVQYDKYRNLYYRLHTDETDMKAALNERKIYLTVLDEDFNKLGEIKLSPNVNPMYDVTEQGILFQFMDAYQNEDFIKVIFLSITRED